MPTPAADRDGDVTALRKATLRDRELLARIAASGFYDDPVMAWAFRDHAQRLQQLTVVFAGLVDDTLPDRGTIHLAGEASAAFWRDPDFEHHRTASDRLEDAAASGATDVGQFSREELERLAVLGGKMLESHPHDRHWYLNVVSTLRDRQGEGLGAAVLQPVLDRCDAEGIPSYLESTNPRNRTLYLRCGFVAVEEVRLPDGPSLLCMWRDPQG